MVNNQSDEYKTKQREYMQSKRQDPAYLDKLELYHRTYARKLGLTYEELVQDLKFNKSRRIKSIQSSLDDEYICPCGGTYGHSTRFDHLETIKHQNYIKNLV
eukprot:Lithocolla_globosa_v1_NODE_347_length_4383_cov_3.684466.p4 type:complete len:102 gc:universal NODE_347_length_4383_cov_3.684466:3311-3006(-)